MAHAIHYRGYRDAFHGREAREADPTYLEGYAAGLRAGDRTRARLVARTPTARDASAVSLAPAADVEGDARPAAGCTLTSPEGP